MPGHGAALAAFMTGAMLLATGTAVFKPGIQGIIALSMKPGSYWLMFFQFDPGL